MGVVQECHQASEVARSVPRWTDAAPRHPNLHNQPSQLARTYNIATCKYEVVCHFHVFFLVEHSDMHSICLSCCSPVAAHSGARAHKQSERTKRSKRAKRKQALSSERGKLLHNPIPNLHFPLGKSRLLCYNSHNRLDS